MTNRENDEMREPRKGCACDNCFYGRDAIALDMLALIARLRKAELVVDAAKDLADCIYPILNLDCEIHGTCKDCLEDGRGTHTEMLEHSVHLFDKALSAYEADDESPASIHGTE